MMAIASIALFFNNATIFQSKGLKIRRGLAVKLILASTDIESVKATYQYYVLELHKKNRQAANAMNPFDKSFVKMATALGKIQAWIDEDSLESTPGQSRIGQKPFYLTQMLKENSVVQILPVVAILLSVLTAYFIQRNQ